MLAPGGCRAPRPRDSFSHLPGGRAVGEGGMAGEGKGGREGGVGRDGGRNKAETVLGLLIVVRNETLHSKINEKLVHLS